jgi:hypothetical protein
MIKYLLLGVKDFICVKFQYSILNLTGMFLLKIQWNLTEPPWDQLLCSKYTGVWFIQVKLTKISYIRTLFKVQFKQDFCLFRVQFKQDFCLFRVQFKQDFCLFRVQFKQDFCLFRVWLKQVSLYMLFFINM